MRIWLTARHGLSGSLPQRGRAGVGARIASTLPIALNELWKEWHQWHTR